MRQQIKVAGILVFTSSAFCGTAAAGDWAVSGFVRQEVGAKTTSDYNANNLQGNPFNGVAEANTGLFAGLKPTLTRPANQTDNNKFNLFDTRIEVNLDGKLSDAWSAHIKLRGIADEIGRVDNAFSGINLQQQPFVNGKSGTPFEQTGKDWMFDLPVAYVDYNNGPLWIRAGNQQIAWGEAIFFRVSDVVNGLDLRRHSVLGPAAEEFSDSRVPSLGIRASYRVSDKLETEGFVHQFQPTLLPSANSPYNVIPAQFTIDEKTGYDQVKNHMDFGFRAKGQIGDVGVQAFAVNRNNPDGVYKWTKATSAGALPGSAFEGGTGTGVYSAQEWFHYASSSRLDGLGGLMASINEFPATTALGANAVAAGCGAPNSGVGTVAVNTASASCILDTFFTTSDLRGWLAREFPRESIFGFGLNRVFEGEPDSFMDQLIGRFELSYTPNKKFTNPTLSANYIEHNETTFAFIGEKYYKFSQDVPATYFVAQWMHKSASDLFGRALEGYNQTPGNSPTGMKGGFDAVAVAAQQPSPTLAWRFDFTALTDLHGGWLYQPGVKWKPNKDLQFDLYANIIKSYGAQTYRNFAQGAEYANEVFLRATLSF